MDTINTVITHTVRHNIEHYIENRIVKSFIESRGFLFCFTRIRSNNVTDFLQI